MPAESFPLIFMCKEAEWITHPEFWSLSTVLLYLSNHLNSLSILSTLSNINKSGLNPSRIISLDTQESWRDHSWDFKKFLAPRLTEFPEDTEEMHPASEGAWRIPEIRIQMAFGYHSVQCCSEPGWKQSSPFHGNMLGETWKLSVYRKRRWWPAVMDVEDRNGRCFWGG